MTTAPEMPGFAKTVNAVVIRSSVWLGRQRLTRLKKKMKKDAKYS